MKIGLVLEGGGMRGLYTAGVLDTFSQQQFLPDYVIGVSAGACNGVSYVSGQRGRNYRINTDYLGDKRYISLSNYLRTRSLFGMDFIFGEVPETLDPFDYPAFLAAPCAFITGVTDVQTGKPVYFPKQPDMKSQCRLLRASSSIPLFSPMVNLQGRAYLDGGTSDPIPVRQALADGCDRVIVVLTRHRGYQKPPTSHRPVYRHAFRYYPAMVRLLDHRHQVYNDTLAYLKLLEKSGKAMVIAPSEPLTISRFEKHKEALDPLYALGQQNARDLWESLAAWMGKA